jgi:hypothetical protein
MSTPTLPFDARDGILTARLPVRARYRQARH